MDAVRVTVRFVKRAAIVVVGITILLIGIIMIVTPGPALVVIPVGLAILGLEFAWARLWLRRIRRGLSNHGGNQRAERAEQHRQRHMN